MIAGVINKLRIVQGWNMISPREAEPVGQVWLEQLDRYQVAPELYEILLNKAIDYRLGFLKRGEQPPSLTVELFLAMYEKYVSEKKSEYWKINSQIISVQQLLERAMGGRNYLFEQYLKPQRKPLSDDFYPARSTEEVERMKAMALERVLDETKRLLNIDLHSQEEVIEKCHEAIAANKLEREEFWKSTHILTPPETSQSSSSYGY